MVPKPRLVTAKAIQSLLTRIGSASSGTKDVIHARLSRDLWKPRLFDLRAEWKARQEKEKRQQLRIMSIDLGIKNLAFCDAMVDYPSSSSLNATMDILFWEKIDLVNTPRRHCMKESQPALGKSATLEEEEEEEEDPYSSEILSQTAYWFLNRHVLDSKPDVILIETQRWRSSNGVAIQQWTVRVNTLEAMIWSTLGTIKAERSFVDQKLQRRKQRGDYEVFGVDPKRVGQYWLGQHAKALQRKMGLAEVDVVNDLAMEEEGTAKPKRVTRSNAEKKAKIALLRSWLSLKEPSTAPSTPSLDPRISFNIGPGAYKAYEALCSPRTNKRQKSKSSKTFSSATNKEQTIDETQIKKLDDVTDCFLQAAAWVAWESNRKRLAKIWEAKRADDGVLPNLNNEILQEMLKELE